jgi:uncharacterized RDD family membrane protein YckC
MDLLHRGFLKRRRVQTSARQGAWSLGHVLLAAPRCLMPPTEEACTMRDHADLTPRHLGWREGEAMSYIKQHYKRLETDELLKLQASELTDEARLILEEELRSREGTEDAVDSPTRRQSPEHPVVLSSLAPLWRRFVAAVIDHGVPVALVMVVNYAAFRLISTQAADLIGYVSVAAWFAYLLFKDGLSNQSVGKRLLGIRVIDFKSGERCSLPQSLVRNLFHNFGIFDWVFVLGKHGRRLGDHVAGTYVTMA